MQKLTLSPTVDTFTSETSPDWDPSDSSELRANNYPKIYSTIWMKFSLGDIPAGATIESATLTLTTKWESVGSVTLHSAPTDWDKTISHRDAPLIGPPLTTVNTLTPTTTFDVLKAVQDATGEVAFAIPPSETERTGYVVQSSETGAGPVLDIEWAQPTSDTLFGASVNAGNRTWQEAVADSDAAYGRMEVVRVFYPKAPVAWPGKAGEVERPVVVSFKDSVKDIAAGKRDDVLRDWFRQAPEDRTIWWSLHHEPEDNVAAKDFTAAQYRAAWQRASKLADEVGKPNLYATLIIMNWTLESGSGRNWRDYYPGDEAIDVIAIDVYNPSRSTTYRDPERMLAKVKALSAETGKPWGIAELGSLRLSSDRDGSQRGAWLRAIVKIARESGAVFVTYWDSGDESGNYRLNDEPSRSAWRDAIAGV